MVAEHPYMEAHPQHGSGAWLRFMAVNDGPGVSIIPPHFQDAIKARNVGSRTSLPCQSPQCLENATGTVDRVSHKYRKRQRFMK